MGEYICQVAIDSPRRTCASLSYARSEASGQGHCGLPYAELVPLAVKLLEIAPEIVEAGVAEEITQEVLVANIVDGRACVLLGSLWQAKCSTASLIERLKAGAGSLPSINTAKAIPWVEKPLSIPLAKSQQTAIRHAITSILLVFTGGPDVGKTTIVHSILIILYAKGVRPLLAAPTGRAAKWLPELTELETKTIHLLLKVNPANGQSSATRSHRWKPTCWCSTSAQ